MNYKADFIKTGDIMCGTGGLSEVNTFEEWMSGLKIYLSEKTVSSGFSPYTTYLAINSNNDVVGMIDIRHRLNDYLFHFGGHIGYSVISSQRNKKIASRMLTLAIQKCKKTSINPILITCDKDNIPSAKVIVNNGGILENEVIKRGREWQRYWITM